MFKNSLNSDKTPHSSLISRLAASTALFAGALVLIIFVFSKLLIHQFFDESFNSQLNEWSAFIAGRINEDKKIAQLVAKNHKLSLIVQTKTELFAFGTDGESISPESLLDPKHDFRKIEVDHDNGQKYIFLLEQNDFSIEQNGFFVWLVSILMIVIGVVYSIQLAQLKPLKWLAV